MKRKKKRRKRRKWKKAEIAILGTMPDSQAASLIGCTLNSVWLKREALGIPAIRERKEFPPEAEELFGILSDYEIARRYGMDRSGISNRRRAAGIAPARKKSNLSTCQGVKKWPKRS